MQSLTDRIYEANKAEAISQAKQHIYSLPKEEQLVLLRYMKSSGACDLAQEFFGIESLDIAPNNPVNIVSAFDGIELLPEKSLYIGNEHKHDVFYSENLSKKELDLLLHSFFPLDSERRYVIDTFFFHNRFLSKTSGDIMDYLAKVEELFIKVEPQRKKSIHLVQDASREHDAANDEHFASFQSNTDKHEVGYLDYTHAAHEARVEFVESLFIEVIHLLGQDSQNHIWALDPESVGFHIPEKLSGKIGLIRSICEFHQSINSEFPMLHNMIEEMTGAWILIYHGFSAPAEKVRNIIHH